MNTLQFIHPLFAHAFGARYDLPIPLLLFVLGGAGVVLLSFLVVLPRPVKAAVSAPASDLAPDRPYRWLPATISFAILGGLVAAGLFGTQELAENILPTVFWLIAWIAVPLSAGLIGDWTHHVNPFANIAKLAAPAGLRRAVLGRQEPFKWPSALGWWPAVILYFILAIGELIFNGIATQPAVIASGLLIYLVISAFMGLLFGGQWLARGEVFNVLYSTWGRLGYFRFGAPGRRGFAGGLHSGFEPTAGRIAFVLLLLVSVAFDGLLSTPAWTNLQHRLPETISSGTFGLEALTALAFLACGALIWAVFAAFARAASATGGLNLRGIPALAGLLPSLLPISFGYLLAHNLQYLITNTQLLFPLLGNPIGSESWPLQLAYPFNDDFEVNLHIFGSSFYWYAAVAAIVIAHIIAIVLAHQYLGSAAKDTVRARRSEYPWVAAMIGYTMLSLWLLAQPLVQEQHHDEETFLPTPAEVSSLV